MNIFGVPIIDQDTFKFPKQYMECGFDPKLFDAFSLKGGGDQTWWIIKMILASLICAIAFFANSQEGVMGTMLISPLGAPIIGLVGALFLWNPNAMLRSFGFLLLGVGIMLSVGYIIGLINQNAKPSEEMIKRFAERPGKGIFFTAIAIGMVFGIGALTMNQRVGMGISEMIGAGLAISLLPPIVNVGCMYPNKNIPEEIKKEKMMNTFLIGAYNMAGIFIAAIICFFTNCALGWSKLGQDATGVSSIGIGK